MMDEKLFKLMKHFLDRDYENRRKSKRLTIKEAVAASKDGDMKQGPLIKMTQIEGLVKHLNDSNKHVNRILSLLEESKEQINNLIDSNNDNVISIKLLKGEKIPHATKPNMFKGVHMPDNTVAKKADDKGVRKTGRSVRKI